MAWLKRAEGSTQQIDSGEVRRALSLWIDPGDAHELRAIPSGRSRLLTATDLDAAVRAVEQGQGEMGTYLTLNPVAHDLAGCAREKDVARRSKLLIDFDTTKLDKATNATEEEKEDARGVMVRVRSHLDSLGWPEPMEIDSGNGWHLVYCLDLGTDALSRSLCKSTLAALADRFDTDRVKIDRVVHNLSRISKLPGTWVRKGPHSPERPHRIARLASAPKVWGAPVTIEQLKAVGAKESAEAPAPPPQADWTMRASDGSADRTAYARSALERETGAVTLAQPGDRNNRLNVAAFNLGQLVAEGAIGEAEVIRALTTAALSAGLDPKEVEQTIRSGLDGGAAKPRNHLGSPHKSHKTHNTSAEGQSVAPGDPGFVGSVVIVGGFQFCADPDWPEPKLHGPDPAEPFPLDVLPFAIRRFCEESAASIQCPVDFLASSCLTLAGAVIGLSVNLAVKSHYNEAPNLYVALVGAPGDKKSPSIKMAARPLWSIDADLREQFRREKKEYQDALKAGDGPVGDPPVHHHLTLDDATREAVAQVHSQNIRGLVVIKDELIGWVKSLNAYKQGKGDDKQFWLSVNSGSLVKVNRKGGEPIIVPQPCVSVVGGLTPDMLPDFRESRNDDGWLDRILFSYPDPPTADEWTDHEVPADIAEDWSNAVRRLWARNMVRDEEGRHRPYYVRFASGAKEAWVAQVNMHRAEKRDPEFPPSLRGPWSKLEGFAARIALILSQLSQACDPTDNQAPKDVDALDIWGAWRLIHYFKAHFRRVRSHLAKRSHEGGEQGEAIMRWLRRSLDPSADTAFARKLAEQGDRKFFSRRDVEVQFNWWDEEDQAAGLSWLVRRCVIQPGTPVPPGGRGGRPPSQVYEVNQLWIHPTITTDPTKPREEDDE